MSDSRHDMIRGVARGMPAELEARLHRVAVDLMWRTGGPRIDEAVILAEDLVAAGFADDATVEVASLRRDAIRSDAESLVRNILAEYEIDLPVADDDAAWFRVLLQAFGFWDLPLAYFYPPFLHQLRHGTSRTRWERTLVRLLDDLDHATDPARKTEVVQSMRAAVR
jgi:hypothetical protein